MAFWQSGVFTTPDVLPDSKPWLLVRGDDDPPWAAVHLDKV